MPNIVVIGAGVSGLTCALELAKLKKHSITVVAKHMPGDYDVEYTSPFAGANVLPMALEADSRWERRSWPELQRLAAEVPEAGIHFQKAVVHRRDKDGGVMDPLFSQTPWYADLMPSFRELSATELPRGIDSGCEFTSICINTAVYLPWLVGQCARHGVVFKRATLSHVTDAARLSYTDAATATATAEDNVIIVNATGLLASRLGGVMDQKMFPIRGQTVIVRNEAPYMAAVSGTDDAADELIYTMRRALGGGTVLGGTYQRGNWDGIPDPNVAVRIMKRAVEAQPQLTGGKGIEALSIIAHRVGLRPGRDGGVRIEKENIDGLWVVHNYGHAGWGYQGSYGCAEKVVQFVDEIVTETGRK